MRYRWAIVVVCIAGLVGCSSDSSTASLPAKPQPGQNPDAAAATPPLNQEAAAGSSQPKYEAVIVINAAKKGVHGPSCSGDMGPTGKFRCGPKASLTELTWEFTEHRDGVDYYKFSWTLTVNGETANAKGLTVGFDGTAETTIIDAEHHIIARRGPLNPARESAK